MSDLLTPQPTHPNDKLLPYAGARIKKRKIKSIFILRQVS